MKRKISKSMKKYQEGGVKLKPSEPTSIPGSSKTKGGGKRGYEAFDPYGDNKSKEGIGVGGLRKKKEVPGVINNFKSKDIDFKELTSYKKGGQIKKSKKK
jgi:hypothetical protein